MKLMTAAAATIAALCFGAAAASAGCAGYEAQKPPEQTTVQAPTVILPPAAES